MGEGRGSVRDRYACDMCDMFMCTVELIKDFRDNAIPLIEVLKNKNYKNAFDLLIAKREYLLE